MELGGFAGTLGMGSEGRTRSRMTPRLLAIARLPRRAQLSAAGLGPGRTGARQEFGFGPVELEGPIRPPRGEDKKACGWIHVPGVQEKPRLDIDLERREAEMRPKYKCVV